MTEKNIFSFLTAVLMWCTGLEHFFIGTRSHHTKKKKLFLATVLDVHRTMEKFSLVLYRHRKRIVSRYGTDIEIFMKYW